MTRKIKQKSKLKKAKNPLRELRNVQAEMDRNARTLIRTDLQLHRANERFDQQIGQLQALHRVGTTINSTFDLEVILSTITESMAKDLAFEKSGIVFLEKSSLKPQQSAYHGFSASEYRELLDQFSPLIMPALQRDEIVVEAVSYSSPEWTQLLNRLAVTSLLLLPMRIKSRLIGFIVGGRAHHTLRMTDNERQFYAMYAGQASTAIENGRLYEALEQSNLTLEEKVLERTKNLMDANERLRELDQAKSNFISLVSHELRTPLTAIKGFIVTLYHYDKDISEEKRKLYLSVLNEETDRLTRLITELLDISRIESGRIEILWEKLTVQRIAQRVFDTLTLKRGSVELAMTFTPDFPELAADPDKLEQILLNLIGNALRFSPEGSRVEIRGHRQGEGVLIEVVDQGAGIPFSEQEKVFDKFYRLDNEVNRKNPGTGLGLPICRALVNLHGGKIWVESEIKEGTHFFFTLPLNLDKLPSDKQPVTVFE